MKIIYEPPAQQELTDATQYYVDISVAVADQLIEEFNSAVARILLHPRAWPPLGKRLRRCLLTNFPYQVIYEMVDDTIYVYAFAHLSRRPNYWHKRLRPKHS